MVALAKRKQDEFQAFYTNCKHITSYMIGLLRFDKHMTVLEPCAGEGVFIDGILRYNDTIQVDAYELNGDSVKLLKEKYSNLTNVAIEQEDFLLPSSFDQKKYDRVIANPPYGAYQTPEKRKQLKKEYPNLYAKETYGLFLVKAMEYLNDNGRLVFIIPDTYLTLHMHEGLRKVLLEGYKIESITLFPSKFFPNVKFGYAGLSIISIVNKKPNDKHEFPVYNGLDSPSELTNLLTKKSNEYEVCRLTYSQLKRNPSSAFFLPSKSWISAVLRADGLKIGDVCSVATGFYSGNDGKYLMRLNTVTRGVRKYKEINNDLICNDALSKSPPLDGISDPKHWVPIVKGGNKRFYKKTEWFMDWSKDAIYDYKVLNKKRARFQNSQYYFKQGIAVPMVSSSSITASLIDGRLFDQSIVGIFPQKKYKDLMYFLLGFFNSTVCNNLIRTINASTNNSSNYIKKIPIIIPGDIIVNEITNEVKKIILLAKKVDVTTDDLKRLDRYFEELYCTQM